MRTLIHVIVVCVLNAGLAGTTFAQVPGGLPNVDLQNRIPAPLGPPPQPNVVPGPLTQTPPGRGLESPPRLNTHGDRTTRCVDQGAAAGLRGGKLDAYTRRCANAN